jgi:flavin reductase (DIM6/NTAB) family NADH-FMN oxidoreductase RutF
MPPDPALPFTDAPASGESPWAGFDTLAQDPLENYKLLTGAVVPRPVAWVTTQSRGGLVNLAPFSSFAIVCSDPPMLAVGIDGRPAAGQLKDTARNLLENGHCVVHVADQALLEALHATSADLPPETSELDLCEFQTLPSLRVAPPRVALAPVALECVLVQSLPMGERGGTLSILRVVYAHVRKSVLRNGRIDAAALNPVCRLGGPFYGELGTLHHRPRA